MGNGIVPCILESMDTLSGSVERITFYNPENGYTVLRLRPEHQTGMYAAPKSSLSFDGLATVVGNLPEVSPGSICGCKDNGARSIGYLIGYLYETSTNTSDRRYGAKRND